MDIRDRVMGDMPEDWLHKIASIVPGYEGYVDRERRRDADKLLRTHLARLYSAQRDRLTRIQQGLVRARRLDDIKEIDRLAGVLQRFTDRLQYATYGYAGMFAPVKVEAEELDQLYAFDMALAGGVDQVESAVDSIETSVSAGGEMGESELPTALSRLSTILDELNERLNQRADLIITGQGLPETEYGDLVSGLNRPQHSAYAGPGSQAVGYPGGRQSGEVARYSGAGAGSESGTPTTYMGSQPPGPSGLSEANQSSETTMGRRGMDEMPMGGAAGTGIETASSPSVAPGAPGEELVEGMDMANTMQQPGDITEVPNTEVPRTN